MGPNVGLGGRRRAVGGWWWHPTLFLFSTFISELLSHGFVQRQNISIQAMFRKGLPQPWVCTRFMVEFLRATSDNTLSFKQVVPHPSKHNLNKCDMVPRPIKLRFET